MDRLELGYELYKMYMDLYELLPQIYTNNEYYEYLGAIEKASCHDALYRAGHEIFWNHLDLLFTDTELGDFYERYVNEKGEKK